MSVYIEDIMVSMNRNPDLARRNPVLAAMASTKHNPKKSKYRNIKVYCYPSGLISQAVKLPESKFGKPSMVFDSIKEYERWNELILLQKAGRISNLERQVPLIVSDACTYQGEKLQAIIYKADFRYFENGKSIVEDVKPFDVKAQKYILTNTFRNKWKNLKSRYPDLSFRIY